MGAYVEGAKTVAGGVSADELEQFDGTDADAVVGQWNGKNAGCELVARVGGRRRHVLRQRVEGGEPLGRRQRRQRIVGRRQERVQRLHVEIIHRRPCE
jgi:hypothetical protein